MKGAEVRHGDGGRLVKIHVTRNLRNEVDGGADVFRVRSLFRKRNDTVPLLQAPHTLSHSFNDSGGFDSGNKRRLHDSRVDTQTHEYLRKIEADAPDLDKHFFLSGFRPRNFLKLKHFRRTELREDVGFH